MLARHLLPVLAVSLALAACGDDGERSAAERTPAPVAPEPAATATATATVTATPAATGDPLAGAGTDPAVEAATNDEIALLTDVRAARHEGYDRIVFEFANALPGYDVRYVERPVRQDGSGREVSLDGEHVLQIRMENALDADLSDPSAPETYTGPDRLDPATPQVVELARVGGFEGVLTWAAGVRERAPFRVMTLPSPPRRVVDVRNGG